MYGAAGTTPTAPLDKVRNSCRIIGFDHVEQVALFSYPKVGKGFVQIPGAKGETVRKVARLRLYQENTTRQTIKSMNLKAEN